MAKRRHGLDAGRRNFLKGATIVGAAALANPAAASPQLAGAAVKTRKADVPGPELTARETQPPPKDPVNQSPRAAATSWSTSSRRSTSITSP